MELLERENRTSGVKPLRFAPVAFAWFLLAGCGGRDASSIGKQADSLQDAGPAPQTTSGSSTGQAPSFDFDAALPSPTPTAQPATDGGSDGASATTTDSSAASGDAGPPATDATTSTDTGTTPPAADSAAPPSSADASADAFGSDDANAYLDVGVDAAPDAPATSNEDSGPPPACGFTGDDCAATSDCCATLICLSYGSCGSCADSTGFCLTGTDCCSGSCNLQTNECQ
jgi:hypothetical protein